MIVTGNFTNYASGVLTGGTYNLAGTLVLPVPTGQTIQTNAATIVLDGGNSSNLGQNMSNALTGFAANSSGGSFTVTNGRAFTTSGAFSNAGALTVGTGSAFLAGAPGSQTVYTQTAGTTTVNGWVQASSVSIQGGILSGVGTVSLIAGPLSVSSGAIIYPRQLAGH